jgi:hypothetical protein
MSGRAYTRLPGVRRGIFTRSSVWLGADHILLIEGTRINERYQRVYLRDILGMVILRKPRFVLQVQWMFVLPAVLIAAAFVPASWRATSFSIATLVDLLILTALYLTSLRHGCRLYFATALGNVFVRSVFRQREAQKLLLAVEPVISQAQS